VADDTSSDNARLLLAAQRAEWLCGRCNVLHPWRPGDFLSVSCPACNWPMTPTSPVLRDLERARARLNVIDGLLPVIRRALKVARAEALYDCQRGEYQAVLDELGNNDQEETRHDC
jgi:hypothetical protein